MKVIILTDDFDLRYRDYIQATHSTRWNIETGFRCRLQCPYCQRQRKEAKQKIKAATEMSIETFLKLGDSCRALVLCGQISDPLYHPKLIEILELKSTEFSDLKLSINTNGSGKSLNWWKKAYAVSDKKTQWVFGLDGASQESANIYRIGTNFDNVLEAMKLGASLGVQISWQYILFQHNEHELEKAREIAKAHKIDFSLLYSNRWPKDHQGIFKSQLQNKTFSIHAVDKIYETTKHKR